MTRLSRDRLSVVVNTRLLLFEPEEEGEIDLCATGIPSTPRLGLLEIPSHHR